MTMRMESAAWFHDPMVRPQIAAVLRPVPESAGQCPRCSVALQVERLQLPGWRMLIEGRCAVCTHWYLQDLPFGHGLVYPATLDLDTSETFAAADAGWFAGWLEPAWHTPSASEVTLEVTGRGKSGSALLLNCLDFVYGHSLLKLLNAQRHLDGGERNLIVLVPRALAHLVPEGVAETWILEGPPSLSREWLLRLDERLQTELDRVGDCVLSPAFPHPHPSTWDLERFTGAVAPDRRGTPSLVLAFRGDRPWGLSARHQELNVRALWPLLRRRFPNAGAALIGVGTPGRGPAGVEDLRVERPTLDDERAWMAAAAGADLVIGVHGSHLLLPSGLAALTLELTPAERHGNVLQATLVRERDPVVALWRYRQILGGRHLADVTPLRVAAVAAEMILGHERFVALMAGSAAGLDGLAAHALPLPARHSSLQRPAPASVVSRARTAAALAHNTLRRRRAAVGAPPPPAVLTDRRGLRFELETADEIESFRDHGGHFEVAELDFLAARRIRGVAIDVGANIGAFTVAMARAAGADGRVYAFEPLESNRRRLRRNLELNGLANVTIDPSAVSDSVGTAELASYGPGYESWTSLTRGQIALGTRKLDPVERIAADVITLDAFCADAGIDRIEVLKIDVEGAEGRVLRGAEELLAARSVRLLLLELSDNTLAADGWSSGRVVRLLRDHGYNTWVVADGGLAPFRPVGPVAFANVVATPSDV